MYAKRVKIALLAIAPEEPDLLEAAAAVQASSTRLLRQRVREASRRIAEARKETRTEAVTLDVRAWCLLPAPCSLLPCAWRTLPLTAFFGQVTTAEGMQQKLIDGVKELYEALDTPDDTSVDLAAATQFETQLSDAIANTRATVSERGAKLRASHDALTRRVVQLENQLVDHEEEASRLRARREDMAKELDTLQAVVRTHQASERMKQTALAAEVQQLSGKVADYDTPGALAHHERHVSEAIACVWLLSLACCTRRVPDVFLGLLWFPAVGCAAA